ncbi:MAG: DUF885 domain-containing protein [Gammaproteobacteria bacterium]|nr:DUF885 domain-containing protein [Gammaproteobacteria bacterium]MBU2058236.1 DUF885 domain-containing protein [Gammaproteobacteria bacterium]MBU2176450.1 DUF885 domain-containing protein [Gammaproteobacteria bacterium]MBU2246377.1 DUF885 domain-containing protein [Gammaproteobacteria bacterium]MBU2345458.1 DUF885 domain-containing protein [Gammaproteobacteria bacterium]
MRLSLLTIAISGLVLTACKDAPSTAQSTATTPPAAVASATQSAEQLYQQGTQLLFQARALNASALGLSEEVVGKAFHTELENYSAEAEAQLRKQLNAVISQLAALPVPADAVEAENQAVMLNIMQYYAGSKDFPQGYIDSWMGLSAFVVNQINGPTIDMAGALQNSHPISNEQDAKNYLSRLEKFGAALKAVEQRFVSDAASGWIAPKVLLEKSLPILDGYASGDVTEHVLYKDFAKKLDQLKELSAEAKQQYLTSAALLVEQQVQAGYRQLAATVRAELPKARTESGIWAQPNGEKFYAWSVKQLGDTELTPEQIHQTGLDEVARISQEMDSILKAQGYAEGTVGARMTALNGEARFLYEDSDAGRQQVLDDLNTYIAEINQRMPELFATKPPYPVEVRRIPVEIQDSAAGGQYSSPAIDGSKPGIYWINLRDIKANAKFDLKTLTYHEANPGHHWQVALNLAQEHLPLLRRVAPYNSYVEGWALYSELVAKEMGMYQDDPFGDLGRLKAELFRSVRLVVDTGLHAKKWTREQAITYMAETTGTTETDVVSEIERYMAWPGQALGYKLGMLKIVELRAYAKEQLGDNFDIKAFHDLVLLGGAVPMSVLDTKVKNWVAGQSSGSKS